MPPEAVPICAADGTGVEWLGEVPSLSRGPESILWDVDEILGFRVSGVWGLGF